MGSIKGPDRGPSLQGFPEIGMNRDLIFVYHQGPPAKENGRQWWRP